MRVIKPEGLKEIKGGAVGDCVCSHGSANAKVDGFWHGDCGSQCSYGSTNSKANYQKANSRVSQPAEMAPMNPGTISGQR